jgi:hypothetical protein
MTRGFVVTLMAWIVIITAFEFYSDYIKRRMIMNAAGVIIDGFAFNQLIQ